MATFYDLLDAVGSYYGSGSDQWITIAKYGISSPESINILKQVPGVNLTLSKSGKIIGYDFNKAFSTSVSSVATIDSNVNTGIYGQNSFNSQLPATADTTQNTMNSGMKVASTGVKVVSIADKVSLAVAGVSMGTKLGKLIDQAIYSVNPQWWDEHFPSINPETWDDMATTETGKDVIRAIFGLEQDSATMYMDENMLAYTYMMLLENGAYDKNYEIEGKTLQTGTTFSKSDLFIFDTYTEAFNVLGWLPVYNSQSVLDRLNAAQNNGRKFIVLGDYIPASVSPSSIGLYAINDISNFTRTCSSISSTNIYNYSGGWISINHTGERWQLTNQGKIGMAGVGGTSFSVSQVESISNIATNRPGGAVFLVGSYTEISGLDGVEDDPTATYHIDPSTLINPTTQQPVTPQDNVSDVLEALRTQYPQLFDGRTYADIPQQDGTVEQIYYIPTPYPNMDDKEKPVTGPNRQQNPQINPQDNTEEQTQQFTNDVTTSPSPPDTGDGSTPPMILPTGSASALFAIYNPTQAELNSFGAWLWSPNFVDQLLKLFNDPMQSIIGLHKVFASPSISGTSTIHVGYLDSGVSSKVIGSQYTDIDCGSINLPEYFGNVFDYEPFTNVFIYLPFIGIHKLNTGEVMRSAIHIIYHVDVLTGACLAEVSVERDNSGGVLYTFAGNCAVQYPVSSGSYMGIVASIASIVGGVVGTVATGGALAPVAMGAIGSAFNAHTSVNHSGNFGGNSGAMGIKTPYLIVTRPQTALADNFEHFTGLPANSLVTLSSCYGRTRVKSVHVENIVNATDEEKRMIEQLLASGVTI